MTTVLAIETATEACSVALFRDGKYNQQHEIAPRQHSQLLFSMLKELIPGDNFQNHGIQTIAYGCGPGSFTGLRIAASAVQGLAFAAQIPAVAISTLACQAHTALRTQGIGQGDRVLSVIDARINEVYYATYQVHEQRLLEIAAPRACAPGDVEADVSVATHAVGSGCRFIDTFSDSLRAGLISVDANLLPEARDLVPLALAKLQLGETQSPDQVHPVYVREEISWKKLSEQGKRP